MRLTIETKEWMCCALIIGEDGMNVYDSRWEWISEIRIDEPLSEQSIFYRKYVEFGGANDFTYYDEDAFQLVYDYSMNIISECQSEIRRRLGLN